MHKLYVTEDQITYGQKYLLDLLNNRKLSEFWNKELSQKFTFPYVFNYAIGKQTPPSLVFINAMNKYVNPAEWFYTVKEEKPVAKNENQEYTDDIRKSVNFVKLYKMYQDKTLWDFCKKNNLGYAGLYHSINQRSLITNKMILKLKEFFIPLDWFILAQ